MEILIYVPKLSSRINYTFRQVCKRILNFDIVFTTKIETFISYKGIKFSYANQRLGNEVFIQSYGLLSEQGVNDIEISIEKWEDEVYFFKTSQQSDIPFDIFSSSFYLMTRYEEYLPHVKNNIGDFPAKESLAYKHNFLYKPIINIWLARFLEILNDKFKILNQEQYNPNVNLNIAIEKAYKYKAHGISRGISGFFLDIFRLRLKDVFARVKTILKPESDPNDVYSKLILLKEKYGYKMRFMFLLGNYSIYTKNINHRKSEYKRLIKSMGDYFEIGLLASHESINDFTIISKEIKRFEQIANHDLTSIMIKDMRINFPDFYVNLDKTDIHKDFSMGYHDQIGFRASTCTPFLFYDLNLEQASPIELHPYFTSSKSLNDINLDEFKANVELYKNFKTCYTLNLSNSDFADNTTKNKILKFIKLLHH